VVVLRKDSRFFIENGISLPIGDFPFRYYKYASIYEVIKYDGRFHFLEKHLQRLEKSVFIAFPSRDYKGDINKEMLEKLVFDNKIKEGNIRIEVFPELKTTLAFLVPHFYPPPEYYEKGVEAVFQYDQRPVLNAKVYNAEIRERANSLIKEYDVFETVLVNMKGEMTEGSRSNIFLIKNGEVFTPPDRFVLPGITRDNMAEFLKSKGIPLNYKNIKAKDAGDYEAFFFTGTSIGALPCRKLDKFHFDVKHPLLRRIIEGFAVVV